MASRARGGWLLPILVLTSCTPVLAAAPAYRVVSTLAAQGRPTAQVLRVDSAARRLYAGRNGGIDVYDIESGKRVGIVETKGTVAGLALAADLERGYASVVESNSVVLFDLVSLDITATVRAQGREPREIEYDAAAGRVYVSNSGSGDLVALDARTGQPKAQLALGGRPRQGVVDGRGHLFVADEKRHAVQVIDTASFKSLGAIPVWPGEAPTALANDLRERRLYVACSNGQMIVVDPDAGQMISYVATKGTGGSGIAMQFAPARFVRLFMPSVDGTLDVVQNPKLTATLEGTESVAARSNAVAFDQASGRAFVAGESDVLVIGK